MTDKEFEDMFVWVLVDDQKRFVGVFANEGVANCAKYTYEHLFPDRQFIVGPTFIEEYWDGYSMMIEAGLKPGIDFDDTEGE